MFLPPIARSPLVVLLTIMACSTSWADTYVTKYDNVNLDEIFNSERLMDNYMKCLKNVGPCTPDGKELKDNLPDALMTDCAKCSEKQRSGSDKVIKFIVANRPDDFATLEQLYDPTGEYRRKYLGPNGTIGSKDREEDEPPTVPTTPKMPTDDADIETEAHASEHNSSPSQDHEHGEGQTDESEN